MRIAKNFPKEKITGLLKCNKIHRLFKAFLKLQKAKLQIENQRKPSKKWVKRCVKGYVWLFTGKHWERKRKGDI